MERGRVRFTGVNARRNRFGFIRPDCGGPDIYFNEVGGYFVPVIEGGQARFARDWGEFLAGDPVRAPFPGVGTAVCFVRKQCPGQPGPKAAWWSPEVFLHRFEAARAG